MGNRSRSGSHPGLLGGVTVFGIACAQRSAAGPEDAEKLVGAAACPVFVMDKES
jgi:hypothetical protein